MEIKYATNRELKTRVDELSKELDIILYDDCKWDTTYNEYCQINSELNRRYREENMKNFIDYYDKNISGKDFNNIDPYNWDFYSDWHKDMFGYRPKTTKIDW